MYKKAPGGKMTSNCQEILRFLNCKYEIFEDEENNNVIMRRYKELKEIGKKENFTPQIHQIHPKFTFLTPKVHQILKILHPKITKIHP